MRRWIGAPRQRRVRGTVPTRRCRITAGGGVAHARLAMCRANGGQAKRPPRGSTGRAMP
ncbi:MAG TPA: hypothetical protein PLK50_12325 [Ottowia sp.]|uniref:hypothetical protein n=1 Tax=Ottowia sp. TaxID=1898956 RepID=UPI002C773FE2|nr:hypothetical protein [Ottowia sp.]HPZ58098.1 hypothetical protein [Ottowia sp.]HQD47734.1 hypothetical protein [Ottowia sp.]